MKTNCKYDQSQKGFLPAVFQLALFPGISPKGKENLFGSASSYTLSLFRWNGFPSLNGFGDMGFR